MIRRTQHSLSALALILLTGSAALGQSEQKPPQTKPRPPLTQQTIRKPKYAAAKSAFESVLQAYYQRATSKQAQAQQLLKSARISKALADLDVQLASSLQSKYWIGVRCLPLTNAVRALVDVPPGTGLQVQSVLDKSAAQKAGIKNSDIIYLVGEQSLKTVVDLTKAIDAQKGRVVVLSLVRKGKKVKVNVAPTARKTVKRSSAQKTLRYSITRPPLSSAQYFGWYYPYTVYPISSGVLPKGTEITIRSKGKSGLLITVKQGKNVWTVGSSPLTIQSRLPAVFAQAQRTAQQVIMKSWVDRLRKTVKRVTTPEQKMRAEIEKLRKDLNRLNKTLSDLEAAKKRQPKK